MPLTVVQVQPVKVLQVVTAITLRLVLLVVAVAVAHKVTLLVKQVAVRVVAVQAIVGKQTHLPLQAQQT